jgi:hypothetical protein
MWAPTTSKPTTLAKPLKTSLLCQQMRPGQPKGGNLPGSVLMGFTRPLGVHDGFDIGGT